MININGLRRLILVCGIVFALVLAGCGKKTQEVADSSQEENANQIEIAQEDNTKDCNIENDTAESTETEATEEIDQISEEETNKVDIINNNGHFVQVDDKVYFHVADSESLGRTALWGNYADNESGRTILFSYDNNTNNTEIVSYDYSSGPIAVFGNVLYSMGYEASLTDDSDIKNVLNGISVNGEVKKLDLISDSDTLLGVGVNDTYIATYHCDFVDDELINQISIYKEGELQNTWDIDGYSGCVKLGKNEIYYIYNYESGYSLRQINVDSGEILDLGILPRFEYSDWCGYVDECIIDENSIYFNYSDYEGTGHFFTQGYFVQAQIGVEDSLFYFNMPENLAYGELEVAMFAVVDGEMVAADGEPGTCDIDNNSGELGYFDEHGSKVKVADGWGLEYLTDDGDYKGIELAEKVGDYIYLYYNGNVRAPEDDIGWRYAYYRDYANVYRVDIKTGESERLIHQAAPWSD